MLLSYSGFFLLFSSGSSPSPSCRLLSGRSSPPPPVNGYFTVNLAFKPNREPGAVGRIDPSFRSDVRTFRDLGRGCVTSVSLSLSLSDRLELARERQSPSSRGFDDGFETFTRVIFSFGDSSAASIRPRSLSRWPRRTAVRDKRRDNDCGRLLFESSRSRFPLLFDDRQRTL